MIDNNKEIYFREMNKINENLINDIVNYKKTMSYMAADAPVEVLCLPKPIETILINNGLLRIYDLINMDLTKIKGIGETRLRDLTSSLDKFLSVC